MMNIQPLNQSKRYSCFPCNLSLDGSLSFPNLPFKRFLLNLFCIGSMTIVLLQLMLYSSASTYQIFIILDLNQYQLFSDHITMSSDLIPDLCAIKIYNFQLLPLPDCFLLMLLLFECFPCLRSSKAILVLALFTIYDQLLCSPSKFSSAI